MKNKLCFFMIIFALVTAGCGGDSDGGSATGTGTGSLSISLIDAAKETYKAVYVTINEVEVHKGNAGEADDEKNWYEVGAPHTTYNLLELVNGVLRTLGVTDLESGKYTQIRLIIGNQPDNGLNILSQHHAYANYIITDTNEIHELKIPSGYQTGIKLVHEFDVIKDLTVDLVLDFDVSKSIVEAGKSGQFLLKPTIKVIDTVENAVISGIVTNEQGDPLGEVFVSAQIYDPQAAQANSPNVATATRTDENGRYQMYVFPGSYYLTAYRGDESFAYGPSCAPITVDYDHSYTQNFQLSENPVGRVLINILNSMGDVLISVREIAPCQTGTAQIEVVSLMVSGDDEYEINLPGGGTVPETYFIVAINGDKVMSQTAEVLAGETDSVSFDFKF